MMTPTLFDLAHIAGLPSNREPISWNSQIDIKGSNGIDFSCSSYSKFVKNNQGADRTPARLVQSIRTSLGSRFVAQSFFRPRIPRSVDIFPKNAISGVRLTFLEKPESPYDFNTFCSFFPWFFDLREDLESEDCDLFPFVGLPLAAIPCFESLDFLSDQAYGDELWAHSLTPQKLRVGAPGEGIQEMRYKMNLYSPQLVARQVGFAQALPSPTFLDSKDQMVQYEITHTDELVEASKAVEERVKNYQRLSSLVRCYYSTKSFDAWCSNYFSSHCPSLEQTLANLNLNSIVQSAPVLKKTKGEHVNEILSFEKFYKVKWNVKWIRPTFYSALEVWERKKAAHEDRCFKKYLKAKAINPFIRRELFMHPFSYPPFPNAQFGIADRLLDPPKGPLSRDYISNPLSPHLCGVTPTPYQWCQETSHLISGYTRIEGYPPGATPVLITSTASDPQNTVEERYSEEKVPKKTKGKTKEKKAKSLSTTTLTSRKRNVIEVTSGATEGPTKIARTAQTQRKKPKESFELLTIDNQPQERPPPATRSNIDTARAFLSNPAIVQRSLSLNLAAMASSQVSIDSTKVDYTPLGHETTHVLISSSCPITTPTTAATSSYLATRQPEPTIFSLTRETDVEDEGPFIVPTPEADDLAFADDEFNLDSILSEAQEVFLIALQKSSSDNLEAGGTLSLPSTEHRKENETTTQTHAEQNVVDREAIISKVNQVLGCPNHSLEEIVASADIKAQLLDATNFLNQHVSSEISSLEGFIEDLFNIHTLLKSSSEDLHLASAELTKHKGAMLKYENVISKVKPLVHMGVAKEQEAELAEKAQLALVEQLEKELLAAK
ncbi:hypothetical protein PIB30_101676 [Stylosanthes scabra]|uniref:Aminotransferase-like plant mobile domain-containing protein n=1 Tax=Stylosanthes scabra TaxID=79078 RepID=A0ABU6YVS0_9FABA|nr:hypothetical protein [Stylosanthes scabra]